MDQAWLDKYLHSQTATLPYFRAILRAVEASYYEGVDLPQPVYDLGCGDGHFASIAFDKPLAVGLDPWTPPLRETAKYNMYNGLVQANGAFSPFPSNHFASAVSNSVLEHVELDQLDAVLADTARILKPGALFYFCVPNHRWTENLHVSGVLRKLGMKGLAKRYEALFIRISRHIHMYDKKEWTARLDKAGFDVDKAWHYFPPSALHALEWGHYWGLPSYVTKKLFNRWLLAPNKWNLFLTNWYAQRYISPAEEDATGTYSFYIARKKA